MPILGNYKVTWEYDPMKYITYCTIKDLEGNLIVETNAQRHYRTKYDKVRVRIVTFKKALKVIGTAKLLSESEIQNLKEKFINLPNKGVV